MPGYEV
jgi:hypothetical protein